ncbi:MAG: TorF family putative porin [Pseudomonadota bacterium]
MKHRLATIAVAALLSSGGAAFAQDASEGVSLEGEIGVVSDYRFRGLSLSGEDAAIQGGLTMNLPQGFYVGVWGSSIEEYEGADIEIDLMAGYAFSAGGVDFDVSAVRYVYPDGENVDFWEIPVSAARTWDSFTGTASVVYAPEQDNLGGEDNWYANLSGEYAPESWPVSVDAGVGYEDGAFADGKVDWFAGVTLPLGPVALSLHYVGYDDGPDGDSTVVAGLSASF